MTISIAHLGPAGTYTEIAAIVFGDRLKQRTGEEFLLRPHPTIFQSLRAVAEKRVRFAVAPVENSLEGSVPATLDALWQFDCLRVRQALVLPVSHAILSRARDLAAIETVYSHPQALAQCQQWLERNLPSARLVPTNSTVEALQNLDDFQAGAISSQRAAQIYGLPVLAYPINDRPDNCTRFWVAGLQALETGTHNSFAFSVPENVPGALVRVLSIFAERGINLSRIESRPTKRGLGEYHFFIDLEVPPETVVLHSALAELKKCAKVVKLFGRYCVASIATSEIEFS